MFRDEETVVYHAHGKLLMVAAGSHRT